MVPSVKDTSAYVVRFVVAVLLIVNAIIENRVLAGTEYAPTVAVPVVVKTVLLNKYCVAVKAIYHL